MEQSKNILKIIKKRKWIVPFCAITITATSLLYVKAQTPSYAAFATVLFSQPIDGGLPSLNNTCIKARVKSIIKEYAADIAVKKMRNNILTASKERGCAAEWPGSHKAVGILLKSVDISRIGKTNMVVINVRSDDPEKSADIANNVAMALEEQNFSGAGKETQKIRQYIEGQIESTLTKLKETENNLALYKTIEADRGGGLKEKIRAGENISRLSKQLKTYKELLIFLIGKLREVKLYESGKTYSFKIINFSTKPKECVKTSKAQIIIICLFFSLFIGVIMIILLEYLDKRGADKKRGSM